MERSKEDLDRECRKMQKLDRWYGILVVSGMILVIVGLLIFDNLTVAFIGVIPALIAVIFISPRIHCPYCGRFLKMKFGLPKYCPHCGKQLTGKETDEK